LGARGEKGSGQAGKGQQGKQTAHEGSCGCRGLILLQIEEHLPLRRQGIEAPALVVLEDGLHHFFRFVNHLNQIQILGGNHVFAHQPILEPVQQAPPEGFMDQDQGNLAAFAGLDQGQGFQQFVQGAEAPGHDHVGAGALHKHEFAGEKVAKGLGNVLERVGYLFVGQLDVEAHGRAFAEIGALVGRFHNARTAAGNHREARVGQEPGDFFRLHVVGRIRGHPGAAEDGNGGPDGGQPFGGLNEFCHNAEYPPGFPGRVSRIRGIGAMGAGHAG